MQNMVSSENEEVIEQFISHCFEISLREEPASLDEILINADNGYSILEFVVPAQSGGMQSEYLKIQHTRTINGLSMSFENNLKSYFSIYQVDSLFYFTCKYDVEYMRMSDQSKGFLDRKHSCGLANEHRDLVGRGPAGRISEAASLQSRLRPSPRVSSILTPKC